MPDLILYDGVCGLCNRLNQFILKRDHRDQFLFAPLQGPLAAEVLDRHGHSPTDLDTVYLVTGYEGADEQLMTKAEAIFRVLRSLGGIWSLARILEPLPAKWLDALYDFVAARRFDWFGRFESCPVPRDEYRRKFIGNG